MISNVERVFVGCNDIVLKYWSNFTIVLENSGILMDDSGNVFANRMVGEDKRNFRRVIVRTN